jgi:microcystin-dependent protein
MKKFNVKGDREGFWFGIQDLQYIQEGTIEALESVIKSQLPTGITACILHGCEVQFVQATNQYVYTGGAIFANGEIYQVNGGTVISATAPYWIVSEPVAHPRGASTLDDFTTVVADVDIRVQLKSIATGIAKWNEIYDFKYLSSLNAWTFDDLRMVHSLDMSEFTAGVGKAYGKYAGWALADGGSGRVDMRSRFVVGRGGGDYANLLTTGGAERVTLTSEQSGLRNHGHLARSANSGVHRHSALSHGAGKHSHNFNIYNRGYAGGTSSAGNAYALSGDLSTIGTTEEADHSHEISIDDSAAHSHTITLENSPALDAQNGHENRPPYIVVGYLVRVGI